MAINKVLYDAKLDTRQNIYAIEGEHSDKIKTQATSVACFVQKKNLTFNPQTKKYSIVNKVPTLKQSILNRHKVALGESESFGQEPTLAFATGFLITDQAMATAAHVFPEGEDISDAYVVFDFMMLDAGTCRREFDESQVYEIEEVVLHSYSRLNWSDYTVVELTKKVTDRVPLTINFKPLEDNASLYMLGFPSGLPLKVADTATVMNNSSSNKFECKVDAFAGNSGSSVHDAKTHEVVGILCVGKTDYTITNDYEGKGLKRYVANRITNSFAGYETCQRMSILEPVKAYIENWSSGFKLQNIAVPLTVQKPGFYVFGSCTSDHCTFFIRSDWQLWGMGTFQLEDVLYKASCTSCEKGSIKVTNFGVHKSRYDVEGEIVEPKQSRFCIQNASALNKMKTFEQEVDFMWGYLKITVSDLTDLSSGLLGVKRIWQILM